MKLDDRNIFFLDGVGAVLSSTCTGIFLPFFYQWTGVPTSVSLPLALLGLVFAIYSLSCFWLVKKTKPAMLLATIFANLAYCALSVIMIFTLTGITLWGRVYFFVEGLIVLGVVLLETKVYLRSFGSFQFKS